MYYRLRKKNRIAGLRSLRKYLRVPIVSFILQCKNETCGCEHVEAYDKEKFLFSRFLNIE
jgi:hypothetical protein